MDIKVLEVQQWLNATYPTYFNSEISNGPIGSYPIDMDGMVYMNAKLTKH